MRRLVVRIFNIVLCVMSAFVVVMLYTKPVCDLTVNYESLEAKMSYTQEKFSLELTNDALEAKILHTQEKYSLDFSYQVKAETIVEVFEKNIPEDKRSGVDIKKIVGEGDLDVKIGIELLNSKMTSLHTMGDDEKINMLKEDVFTPIIKSVVENERVQGIIDNLAKEIAKKAAKSALKSAFETYMVKDEDKGKDNFLEEAGINDEFYDSHIESLYDSLTQENATIDTVTDTICDCITDAMQLLGDMTDSDYDNYSSDSSDIAADIEAQKENIKEELQKTLEEYDLVDQDGNITSVEDAMALIIQRMMDEASGESGGKPSIHQPKYADPSDEDVEEEKKSLTETVTDAAWKMIDEKIFSGETRKTICDAMGYTSEYGKYGAYVFYVVYAFMGLWGLLFVFALIHTFMPKKVYIYTGFFFWFFFIIFGIFEIVLGAVPLISSNALSIVSRFGVSLPDKLSKLSLSLQSSFTFSFIASVVLFIFAIVYACFARRLKKERKAEKRALRAAAKAY